jgi:hypothetical protein
MKNAKESTKEVMRLRKALGKMADLYAENRSDISDMCVAILNGEMPRKENVEHRYVKWNFNGTDFIYDTLTTLVEMRLGYTWVPVETKYENG